MDEGKRHVTRRDFIKTGYYTALGGLIGVPLLNASKVQSAEQSRVILIREQGVVDSNGFLFNELLENMLDTAMIQLTEQNDAASAWASIFSPSDTVGIKSNVWHHLPTPAALENIITNRLIKAGIRTGNIGIDDRGVLQNKLFKGASALINIRPMRTHHWSGLGTLLKNYIMFTPSPWMYHGNACERLGAIWQMPRVKGKTRLNILVMLTPLFHGIGPHHFSKSYIWPYGGLILSTDPVAADTVGAHIIQAKRNAFFNKNRPISPPPRHIAAADIKYGLGNSQLDRINLIKIGWAQDRFV